MYSNIGHKHINSNAMFFLTICVACHVVSASTWWMQLEK